MKISSLVALLIVTLSGSATNSTIHHPLSPSHMLSNFSSNPKSHDIKKTRFEYLDLLMVNGEYNGTIYKNQIVLFLEQNQNYAVTKLITITNPGTAAVPEYEYDYRQQAIFPNEALRPLLIKKSRLKNQASSFSLEDRWKIQCICDTATYIIECRDDEDPSADISISCGDFILCFGLVGNQFGLQGIYYSFNYLNNLAETPRNVSHDFLTEFIAKYLRNEHNLLANSAIANGVKEGDLMRVKTLKPQKNAALQIKVQHFGGSFGEITTFIPGNLRRKNSRNQTEFAIRSLFSRTMKLALRPKYLLKVTKIYIHRISNPFSFAQFRELVLSLLSDQSKNILYLPHRIHHQWESPYILMDKFSIFMLQQRDRQNFIHDIVIWSSFAINGMYELPSKLPDICRWFFSFPFFMTCNIWEHVVMRLRMTSNPTKNDQKN